MTANSVRGLGLEPNLVSLIVPCYNVEKYFDDFLQSVLKQTYKDIEVILINDGANEATTHLLREAVPVLEAEGYLVKLVEQQNKGLGGAVDTGLKHFTGEFLMWPDPDDWLLPNSLERRVELMRENPDIGLLRSNAELFIEAKQTLDGHFMPTDAPASRVPHLFEDLVFQRFFYGPVCHFVRSEMFLKVHPDRTIYFAPASSQNFQLLVPFVESFPVLQVPEPLAVYRIREDSRSRAPTKTHEKLMGRHEQLYDLTVHTLPKLKTYSEDRAARVKNQHWRNKMLPTAIRAKMADKGAALIQQADLPGWRKALARACLALRCNRAFDTIDQATGRVASRIVSRSFDALVRMPQREVVWGAEPLWSTAGLPQ
ncbi:MAG: glycosyltransferase family A protein [Henriciella sp.]|nr:glycosyltransferase family A protein [Henriciella sp.]